MSDKKGLIFYKVASIVEKKEIFSKAKGMDGAVFLKKKVNYNIHMSSEGCT